MWEPNLGLRWFVAVAGKEVLRFWREGNCCYNLFGGFFLTENSKYFISIPSDNKVLDFVHYKWLLEAGASGRWLLSPHEVTP